MADKIASIFTAGQGKLITVTHSGPSYYTTGGETLGTANNQTGITVAGLGTIDNIVATSVAQSGNYGVHVVPLGSGEQRTWKLLWVTATSFVPGTTQVTSTTDLSAEKVQLTYIGR